MNANLNAITPVSEIIGQISVLIYQPAFEYSRNNLDKISEVLRNVVLFINFDTEVMMGGILTFLENSTGAYLPETITAFEAIGAYKNAQTLAGIKDIMQSFGVSHERLRQGLDELELYEVTTFEKTHGAEMVPMAEAVQRIARNLYLYDGTEEDPYELLEQYVERHREEILAAINAINEF